MKIRTQDLEGDALDWAVAKVWEPGGDEARWLESRKAGLKPFFSRDWRFGGPLLEYCLPLGLFTIGTSSQAPMKFTAALTARGPAPVMSGDTLLVAVCRGYVAFKRGLEIDIPQEVLDLAPVA